MGPRLLPGGKELKHAMRNCECRVTQISHYLLHEHNTKDEADLGILLIPVCIIYWWLSINLYSFAFNYFWWIVDAFF